MVFFFNDNKDDILSLLFADDLATVSDTIIGLKNQLTVIESFCNYTGININYK